MNKTIYEMLCPYCKKLVREHIEKEINFACSLEFEDEMMAMASTQTKEIE